MKKPEPKEYVIQPKGWRKKYKCHKNKSDHTFVIDYAYKLTTSIWQKPNSESSCILEYYECNACGKKSMESSAW